ncbi:MAG: single-stranded DNA-binding protein [Magnetococcales bacterium]|nr:single-stranded DNA-binding protein [Magnetococcales bacterium]
MNLVVMIGNLTRNPELRYTPSGTPVATFGLACNRRFKQGDELKEEVTFIDVVAFGKMAESVAQYKQKGDKVGVTARLQQQRWETEDGQKRSKHQLVANSIEFVGAKKDGGGGDPGDPESGDPDYS